MHLKPGVRLQTSITQMHHYTQTQFFLQFHLDQAKERSKIRIEDGRAKPIDLLAKYINAEDDDMSVEMHEPYTYLEASHEFLLTNWANS